MSAARSGRSRPQPRSWPSRPRSPPRRTTTRTPPASCSTRVATDPVSMRGRYAELLSEALEFPANAESYLDDIDGSFYVTQYLRSWAFEAQLREFLRSEFGNEWFASRDAGGLLRELWSLGQGPDADELLKDVTGATLEMAAVADRIREGLDI